MRFSRIAILVALLLGLGLSAVGAEIVVGAKNFTEQYVVGNLMYLLLEDRGYDVELKTGMSTTVIREAMVSGDVDMAMSYTGNGWLLFPEGGNTYQNETPLEMYEKARDHDIANGLAWLEPIWCNNTYAIAVTSEFAETNDIYTLTEFADYVTANDGDVAFCSTFEFYARPDGVLGWQLHYGFAFQPGSIKTVLPGLTFEPLITGEVVATTVFGTDPIVAKYNCRSSGRSEFLAAVRSFSGGPRRRACRPSGNRGRAEPAGRGIPERSGGSACRDDGPECTGRQRSS